MGEALRFLGEALRAPLVVTAGVVLLAAVVGGRADGVERCCVCCAVQACLPGIDAEKRPLRHWDCSTNYASDFFGALVEPEKTCFN